MYQVIKGYKEDKTLRASFNKLAQETFGLTFENWYQNGFWNEKYIPYSIVEDHKIAANVSVNLIDMCWNGEIRHFLQLGTVMTAPAYRNRGMIRRIMDEIFADYEGKTDGIYLFANDSVTDFYPKFGFMPAKEYQYTKEVAAFQEEASFQPIPMKDRADWKRLVDAIESSRFYGRFDLTGNSDLIMFYVTQFMQDQVFYDAKRDAYAIAEMEEECLFLQAVYSKQEIGLDEVIAAFGSQIKKVVFGFVPAQTEGCQCAELKEEDTTLFMRGIDFGEEKLMFPILSHA